MSEDISSLMNQINNMIKNNEIPDEIKGLVKNLTNNSQNTSQSGNSPSFDKSNSKESVKNNAIPEIDMATMMKAKKIIDSMKKNGDDPRAKLLESLKPYLKDSRKEKVDQYINLFGISKAFEMFNSLGGDNPK